MGYNVHILKVKLEAMIDSINKNPEFEVVLCNVDPTGIIIGVSLKEEYQLTDTEVRELEVHFSTKIYKNLE